MYHSSTASMFGFCECGCCDSSRSAPGASAQIADSASVSEEPEWDFPWNFNKSPEPELCAVCSGNVDLNIHEKIALLSIYIKNWQLVVRDYIGMIGAKVMVFLVVI